MSFEMPPVIGPTLLISEIDLIFNEVENSKALINSISFFFFKCAEEDC